MMLDRSRRALFQLLFFVSLSTIFHPCTLDSTFPYLPYGSPNLLTAFLSHKNTLTNILTKKNKTTNNKRTRSTHRKTHNNENQYVQANVLTVETLLSLFCVVLICLVVLIRLGMRLTPSVVNTPSETPLGEN